MQLRTMPVTPVVEGSDELDLEAQWIYDQAFCKDTISKQDSHLNSEAKERPRKGPQTVGKIKKALDFMRNQHFEVPFISFYRKEYVLPELNINDLWKVYKFDAKWCQLRQRKENLTRLFQKMMDYQIDQVMQNPDAPLSDNFKRMTDDDIDRLQNVQTNEELNDVHQHFMLYYSHDIPAMQEAVKQKEKELKHQEKIQKHRQQVLEAEENGEEPPPEIDFDIEDEEQGEVLKQAVRTGPYALCRKAGLNTFAKKFGLTPVDFAKNLRETYQRYEVEQDPVEPTVVAQDYLGGNFSSVDEVLKAVQLMVAIQLAREPLVRKCVREMYMERAKVTIKPTKIGLKMIDEAHPIYTMKYLKDKPVRDFIDDQFLKLAVAEEDKLITITLNDKIDGLKSDNYVNEIKQLYIRDEFSKNVQDWNNLRMGSVERALTEMVIPSLKKELKANLIAEAKESVMRNCCRKMYNWIKIAPFTCESPDPDDDEWDTSKGLRVMAIAYVPDLAQAAFTCIVAPDGECTDYLKLEHLLKREKSFREDEKHKKRADLLAIKKFISNKKPHAVVIGGESREAKSIAADITKLIAGLAEDEGFPQIAVEICDNHLAKVYANSNKGTIEFRDYPLLLREAISLARRLQDPLVEFSQLCTPDEEILCLRYHPLQDQLSKEELLENLYLEFVNRVNEVGVDINKAVQQAYSGNLLQFVCGLGPRKGAALIKVLKQSNQRLENRTQLVTACHMGPKVFINCAGFIKIDTNSLGDSTEAYVEVLDGSRVHPETYEWARKMAVDALEYNDEDAAGALEEILAAPKRLKDLDLDAFAEELERQGFGNKCVTLYDIRAELNCRYKDLRTPYQSPSPEKLFDILTKETPETFYIGKRIDAIVTGISRIKPKIDQCDNTNPVKNDATGLWQCPICLAKDFSELSDVWNHFDAGHCPGKGTGVKLQLDNGISGFIHVKNLSNDPPADPAERVQNGQTVHCRIIKIEVDRFSVECTSKSSDLADVNHDWRPQRDEYYDTEQEEKDMAVEKTGHMKKSKQSYLIRVITNSYFKNIDYSEAEKIMKHSDTKQGDAIIRPSRKGVDHLTVTWKITDDIFQHIDIKEEDKPNSFSLGQRLYIGNRQFDDLDEIIANYINPMAANVAEILEFKYYKPEVLGLKDKADEILKVQKRDNPNSIPYLISAVKRAPGNFMLSYLPRDRVIHEYIQVTPVAFQYRRIEFKSINELIRWFKEHFREQIPGQATPSTPRGAMTSRTPYHTTPGVSSSMNQEAIHRVAQNLPHHMLHSLSQVANHTPHHYQPHTPGATGASYGATHTYPNTPYTPSGQTPFMTPYQQPTPRYGQQTPTGHQFAHPSASGHHRTSSSSHHHRSSDGHHESMDWEKAAAAWARGSNTTPRYDDNNTRKQSSRGYHETSSGGRSTPRTRPTSGRTPSYKSPRGTPHTNSSPRSMSLSGDGTPLYDES